MIDCDMRHVFLILILSQLSTTISLLSYCGTALSQSIVSSFQVVSWIMTIWLFGSAMIFVLARVLGGDVNYSQCLGVIGYSVLPLFIVGLVLPVTHSLPWLHTIIKVSSAQLNGGRRGT